MGRENNTDKFPLLGTFLLETHLNHSKE